MGIKKYLEEKAKRAALLGLTTATILGGGATLTGCENQNDKYVQVRVDKKDPKTSIENVFEEVKEDLEIDHIDIQEEVDGKHSIVLRDGETLEDGTFQTNAYVQCEISEDVFDEIGRLYDKKQGHIVKKSLNYTSVNGVQKELVSYHLEAEALTAEGNMDILNIIATELSKKPGKLVDYEDIYGKLEAIKECENSGGHKYVILEKKDNDGYTDSQVCKDGALYEYICQKCGTSFTDDIAPTLHEAMGVDSATTFGYTSESGICQSCGERIHREYFGENETPWESFPTR